MIAVVAILISPTSSCTPLVVALDGHSVILATNSVDTNGDSVCKLHFSKNAVVMQAAQAASLKFIWPNGKSETLDFEAELNNRIKDLNYPVDQLKTILVNDAEEQITSILQRYKATSPQRRNLARQLTSEYVLVGKDRHGFLAISAFTLGVLNPEEIIFDVQDLSHTIHNGEIIDYSEGQYVVHKVHGVNAIRQSIYSILQDRNESAKKFGNKAFSPPYLIMRVDHSGRYFLSNPGVCHSQDSY